MALNIPKRNPAVQAQAEPAAVRTRVSGNGTKKSAGAPAFVRATGDTRHRLIVNIQGEEKSGKNHMAFSYTGGPIYVHSFDIGLEGVVDKFQASREIYVAEYELAIQPGEASDREVGEAANKVWESFVGNFKDSISSTRQDGLVIVDTGTETWELLRLASFGKLTQVMPHHYGKPNAEMRELVRTSFDGNCVAWLHKCVDEWENFTDSKGQEKGRKTGRKTRKGFNDIQFLVQVTVETHREDLEGGGSEFTAHVIDHRTNPDMNGMVLENSLDTLLEMTFA